MLGRITDRSSSSDFSGDNSLDKYLYLQVVFEFP